MTDTVVSKWLTAIDAAKYLGLPSVRAFYSLRCERKRAGKPVLGHRIGRSLRFKTKDLDNVLDREAVA